MKKKLLQNAFNAASTIENVKLKKQVIELVQHVMQFANQHKEQQLNSNTKKYILQLDSIRNTNIKEVCPELAEYF